MRYYCPTYRLLSPHNNNVSNLNGQIESHDLRQGYSVKRQPAQNTPSRKGVAVVTTEALAAYWSVGREENQKQAMMVFRRRGPVLRSCRSCAHRHQGVAQQMARQPTCDENRHCAQRDMRVAGSHGGWTATSSFWRRPILLVKQRWTREQSSLFHVSDLASRSLYDNHWVGDLR